MGQRNESAMTRGAFFATEHGGSAGRTSSRPRQTGPGDGGLMSPLGPASPSAKEAGRGEKKPCD
jgi:hypothetical protein